jgi:hypothetical protein
MSPEQVGERSHHADARADIYGLGVVLYRLMTGRLPFVADLREQWVDQILHRAPRPPRTIDDAIPQELERVCLKCLSKDVEERYSTAADLARELRGAVEVRAGASRSKWQLAAAASVGTAVLLWGLAPILRRPEPPPGDLITPLPLLWPVHDEISSFWPDNNGRRLHVHCEQYGLVQLGELTSVDGDVEILVHIGQVNWDAADIGLFWGFRRADDNDDSQQFESLEVDVQYDGQFVLDRSLTTFERLHDEDRGRIGLANAAIDPPADGEHRLLVRFTAGRLSHVEWDGVPRPELLNALFPGEMSDPGNMGKFGVLVNGTGGSFSRLKWNDRELRFAARPVQ